MGLDMYLYKRTFVGNQYREAHDQVKVEGKGIKQARVSEVVEQVAYWRKANQVHNWFVANACGGVDDCEEHRIERSQLEALLFVVRKVLKTTALVPGKVHNGYSFDGQKRIDHYEDGKVVKDAAVAQELLPTAEGFFFGGTGYDQWYVADLEATEKMVAEALAEGDEGDFYYRASW